MLKETIGKYISLNRVLLLGFGKEGRSSYTYLSRMFPALEIDIMDTNPEILNSISGSKNFNGKCFNGLQSIAHFNYDLIIKSPGVKLSRAFTDKYAKLLSSQTSLFLEAFQKQTIGISGTKGKSTTSSLLYEIFKNNNKDVVLLGNIGIPAFDHAQDIKDGTLIVYELSANQLEFSTSSPHIAVLLNLYEEHLDYFGSLKAYFTAKSRLCKFQKADDILIVYEDVLNHYSNSLLKECSGKKISYSGSGNSSADNVIVENTIVKSTIEGLGGATFEDMSINGNHNKANLLAAVIAASVSGLEIGQITGGVKRFKPLAHRLEYLGCYSGIHFYNDSISTIAESTIAALDTLINTETLILGGYDRGISYNKLIDKILQSKIKNTIFTGPAGKRMLALLNERTHGLNCYYCDNFRDLIQRAFKCTSTEGICLLSPAASSYDQFINFEARGQYFKQCIIEYSQKNDT